MSKNGSAEGGNCGCAMGGDNLVDGGNDLDNDAYILGGYAKGGDIMDDDDDEDENLPAYWNKKSLGKKIKQKKKFRKLMLTDFKKLLKSHYQKIVDAASHITKNIGGTIPITDDLERFVTYFQMLEPLDQENLHVALSGYPKDSVSKEKRDQFLNKYNLVSQSLDPLVKGPSGTYFKSIQSAIDEMIKTIDNFSDKLVSALTEIHIDHPSEIAKAVRATTNRMFGGYEGTEDTPVGNFIAFNRVKDEMKYYLSISNIKTNLSKVGEDITEFGDDYEQVLGEEAAWLIENIKNEYNQLIDAVDVKTGTPTFPPITVPAGITPYTPAVQLRAAMQANEDNAAEVCTAASALSVLFKFQLNSKIKMVEVAQAVDLYLRAFADGIAKNPDSISTVIKMLDQVEIVAKWFTEKSGDNLAGVFETFPSGYNDAIPSFSYGDAGNAIIQANNAGATVKLPNEAESEKHYYAWLESKWATGNKLPGNPFLGLPIIDEHSKEKVKAIAGQIDKTIKSMRALENILSAFASVGSKFGDLDPQSKTFMNPGQIFNAICQYVTASSITTSFLPNTPGTTSVAFQGIVGEAKINNGTADEKIPFTATSHVNMPSLRSC